MQHCFPIFESHPIEAVHERQICARDKVPVCVDCHLDGTVAHLLFDVGERCAVLDELRPEGMPQIVESNLAYACFGEDGQEVAMVQVIGI